MSKIKIEFKGYHRDDLTNLEKMMLDNIFEGLIFGIDDEFKTEEFSYDNVFYINGAPNNDYCLTSENMHSVLYVEWRDVEREMMLENIRHLSKHIGLYCYYTGETLYGKNDVDWRITGGKDED